MCGIVALFSPDTVTPDLIYPAMERMERRGPDGGDIWTEGSVALGHRRLAIIDLDTRSAQPMISGNKKIVIIFNGEIYNYKALKVELIALGHVFITNSDTEVLIALYEQFGRHMLTKIFGMFGLVIWDRDKKIALIARDPYGIKPLYFAKSSCGGILVGSQVKALMATGLVSRKQSLISKASYWMLGSVPEPLTWFNDVEAIPAGSWLVIDEFGKVIEKDYFWTIDNVWARAEAHTFKSLDVVQKDVHVALKESVRRHIVSDVPIGIFLSGGVDSAALAGLLVELGVKNLTAVTITYDEFSGGSEDEVPVAREIAGCYGLNHIVRRVTREEFLNDIPSIIDAMDQPTIDGVNTWYASKAISELGIKVVISGVGGDELFFGYRSFKQLPLLVNFWGGCFGRIIALRAMARLCGFLLAIKKDDARWRYAYRWALSITGAWWLRRSIYTPSDLKSLMPGLMNSEEFGEGIMNQKMHEMSNYLPRQFELALAKIESTMYLRNQLLKDADWASMYFGVELRTPLVDRKLLENISKNLSVFKSFPAKKLLSSAPQRPLPSSVVTRKKTGFGIPLASWLKNSDYDYSGDRHQWMKIVADSFNKI